MKTFTNDAPVAAIPTEKMKIGEKVEFASYIVTPITTDLGESSIINFLDKKDEIIRVTYGSGGLEKFLNQNKNAKSVTLKKQVINGDFKLNVWSE